MFPSRSPDDSFTLEHSPPGSSIIQQPFHRQTDADNQSGEYDPQGEPINEAHSIVLQNENYANTSRWQDLGVLSPSEIDAFEDAGSPVYDSDATLQLASGLEDKFYVVKPVEMDSVQVSYVNIGNLLFEQRDKLLGWITNHAGDPEAGIALGIIERRGL